MQAVRLSRPIAVTLTNGPTWTASTVSTHLGGRYALSLEGVDHYVHVRDQFILTTPILTVAAWVNADTWKSSSWEGII